MPPESKVPQPQKKRVSLSFDLRLLVVILLVVIGSMLFLWKPWQSNIKASDRTVTVTGDAVLTAEPDEYVFNPNYEFNSSDKQKALAALTKKSNEVVAKLKILGVPENKIKTNSSNYSNGVNLPTLEDNTSTYTLNLTVTVDSKELAQKIQDYLITTSPTGSISPQATFSDAKNKALQSQARDKATKDARAKADQSATNLGFKIAGVKSVTDGNGFGYPVPLSTGAAEGAKDQAVSSSLNIQPGENQLQYSVTVVYYIH